MREDKVFSELLPSHPDFLPILQRIRAAYDIPEVDPDDDGFIELILSDNEVDWKAVRVEITKDVTEIVITTLPDSIRNIYEYLQTINLKENTLVEPPEILDRDDIPQDIRLLLATSYTALLHMMAPLEVALERMCSELVGSLMKFLMTGKTRDIPSYWFGGVFNVNLLGETYTIAVGSQVTNPKEISDKFLEKYAEVFGEDRPTFTDVDIDSLGHLRMKLAGMSIKDIADIEIQRNPDDYPKITDEKDYHQAKNTLEEKLKKRMQRLNKTIDELIGDKN